jgi:hypothetical protein
MTPDARPRGGEGGTGPGTGGQRTTLKLNIRVFSAPIRRSHSGMSISVPAGGADVAEVDDVGMPE